MAAPDVRDKDQPVKAIILTTVANQVKAAVIHFANARHCIDTDPAFVRFKDRIGSIDSLLPAAYEAAMIGELPFTIRTDKLAREWHDLKTQPKTCT